MGAQRRSVHRDGRLAGGLYGVRINGLFAGESMFHIGRDASKVALMALVQLMRDSGMTLLDVQWATDHLASLGAVEVSREDYLALLADAVAPGPQRPAARRALSFGIREGERQQSRQPAGNGGSPRPPREHERDRRQDWSAFHLYVASGAALLVTWRCGVMRETETADVANAVVLAAQVALVVELTSMARTAGEPVAFASRRITRAGAPLQ